LVFQTNPNGKPVGQTDTTTFTVEISDSVTSRTNSETTVTTVALNRDPIAGDDSGAGFTTTENTAFDTGSALGNDTDLDIGDANNLVILQVITNSALGQVTSIGNGVFHYDPKGKFDWLPQGATATDFFSYIVADSHGARATGRVTITIAGVNTAPVALPDHITFHEHAGPTVLNALLQQNDFDPDSGETAGLNLTGIDTTGTRGNVTFNAGILTYDAATAAGNLATGSAFLDSFAYTIEDPHGLSASAKVSIVVDGENDPPVALIDQFSFRAALASTNLTAGLLSNDSDPDPGETASLAVVSLDTARTAGKVTLENGAVVYFPGAVFASLPPGSNFVDTFDYIIEDIHGAQAKATVVVTNVGVNSAPIALPDTLFVSQAAGAADITSLLLTNDFDLNSDETASLRVTGFTTTNTKGLVVLSNNVVLYTPPDSPTLRSGQTIEDSFSYLLSDIHGADGTGDVRVVITGQDFLPLALPDAVTLPASADHTNITALLLANDSLPVLGIGPLSIGSISTLGAQGIVELVNNQVSYTAKNRFGTLPSGQTASDGFSYEVSDALGNTVLASVSITILGNSEPVPGNDTIFRSPGQSVKVSIAELLSNDTSTAPPLTLSLPGNASINGATVTREGGWVIYSSPVSDLADSFSYTVADSQGITATGTVNVIVQPDDAQSKNILSITIAGGETVIRFVGIPGLRYSIQSTEDLNSSWSTLDSHLPSANGEAEFRDNRPSSASRYYRTVLFQ